MNHHSVNFWEMGNELCCRECQVFAKNLENDLLKNLDVVTCYPATKSELNTARYIAKKYNRGISPNQIGPNRLISRELKEE